MQSPHPAPYAGCAGNAMVERHSLRTAPRAVVWTTEASRAWHLLLCVLAYWVQRTMQQAWAPLLFADGAPLESGWARSPRRPAQPRPVRGQRPLSAGIGPADRSRRAQPSPTSCARRRHTPRRRVPLFFPGRAARRHRSRWRRPGVDKLATSGLTAGSATGAECQSQIRGCDDARTTSLQIRKRSLIISR